MCEEKESYAFVSYEVGLSVNWKQKKKNIYLKKWYASKQMSRYHTEEHSEEFFAHILFDLEHSSHKNSPSKQEREIKHFPL